ncbi:MAG TPA: hypothetical protein VLF95_07695 [Vicinamibacteria bacterium]|nr:hypothetical protein [Vicinamibacteria bacterium]
MKRSWPALLSLALLAPACRTAGPEAPPSPPAPLADLLRPYEGALRVLVYQGDTRALTVRSGQRLAGTCDVAVRIRSVVFDKGAARFALESLGLPRVGGRRVKCKRLEPDIQLALTGFPSGPVTPEVTARIDEVLLTPEAYLRSKGTAFERPPGEAPSEVASRLTDASDGERRLARGVVAWPQPLLSVDALLRAPRKRAHFERLVEVEAVVGTDGRLYRPQVKSSLDPAQTTTVLGVLPFWRFEPARRGDAPVGARVSLELALRVY